MSKPSLPTDKEIADLVGRAVSGDSAALKEVESKYSEAPINDMERWLSSTVSRDASAQHRVSVSQKGYDAIAARVLVEARATDADFKRSCDAARSELAAAIDAVPLVSRPGWDEEAWGNYDPSEQQKLTELPDGLCLGHVRASDEPDTSWSPVMVPFVGQKKTLVFSSQEKNRQSILDTMQSLVWRIATALPNQASFLFVDPHNSGNAFIWANRLPGRINSSGELTRDLEAVEKGFKRIGEEYLDTKIDSFEKIPAKRRRREKLQIVVIADFPNGLSNPELNILRRIANNGMESGTYLMLHWDTTAKIPPGFEMDASGIKAFKYAYDPIVSAQRACEPGWRFYFDNPPSGDLQSKLLGKLSNSEAIKNDVGFVEQVGIPRSEWWKESAMERLVTPIGLPASDDDQLEMVLGETRKGDPVAHGVMAATTGAGKSNLLHVFILGLAMRYSPEQLRFYLVDMKKGVEFKPYEKLPHTEVISLDTSPQMARSVLTECRGEMNRRNELFSKLGLSDYKDYSKQRSKSPEKNLPALPRLLLIVDEYQQLFDDDRDGEASTTLLTLAKQARSAGIHMLLASQSFSVPGMMKRTDTFDSIHLRIAMRLSPTEVKLLQDFQGQGKDAIKALEGSKGKVVINDHNGSDNFNVSGLVSLVTREEREQLVQELAGHAVKGDLKCPAPIVFKGLAQPKLMDNRLFTELVSRPVAPSAAELEKFAKKPSAVGGAGLAEWYAAEQPRIGWIGQEFNVRGHATVILKRKNENNVAIVGDKPNARHGMMLSLITSFAVNLGAHETEFAVIDCTPKGSEWEKVAPSWIENMTRSTGGRCKFVTGAAGIDELLTKLEEELEARKLMDDHAKVKAPSIILGLLEPDRLEIFKRKKDAYGAGADSPSGAKLRKLFTEGPSVGIHVVLSVENVSALDNLIDLSRAGQRKGLGQFRYRLVLRMSADDSEKLIDSRAASDLQANGEMPICALLHDAGGGNSRRFKPYVAVPIGDGQEGVLGELTQLADILSKRTNQHG